MDYGLISKVEKAKRYAEQTERIRFEQFTVAFDGDNNPHHLKFSQGNWNCDCNFFITRGFCSHTMAMERILGPMLPTSTNGASSN
ncbi:MAG: hypothetical protein JXA42_04585 [Anaerolineales bacterium]|nr:hypothetical protein [Anaerolineales bacterium]